jgi:hypothetical protein
MADLVVVLAALAGAVVWTGRRLQVVGLKLAEASWSRVAALRGIRAVLAELLEDSAVPASGSARAPRQSAADEVWMRPGGFWRGDESNLGAMYWTPDPPVPGIRERPRTAPAEGVAP